MEVVDFTFKTSTMTHPDYWTIIKLWSENYVEFPEILKIAEVTPIYEKANRSRKTTAVQTN